MSRHYDTIMGNSFFRGVYSTLFEAVLAPPQDNPGIAIARTMPKEVAAETMMWGVYSKWRQTFEVGPNMLDVLCSLEADHIPSGDMDYLPPYPSYYIELPSTPDHWRIHGGERSGWHQVNGMYVVWWDEAFSAPGLHMGIFSTHDVVRCSVCLIGEPLDPQAYHSGIERDPEAVLASQLLKSPMPKGMDDATFRFNIPKKGSISESVEDAWNTHVKPQVMLDESQKMPDKDMILEVSRLVVNLNLYLNSYDPELEVTQEGTDQDRVRNLEAQLSRTKPTKKHYQKRLDKLRKEGDKCTVTAIAPNLERDLANQERRQDLGGAHRKVWVKAHKQRYWYNETDEEGNIMRDEDGKPVKVRRWRWKLEYQKGSDVAECIRKKYNVQ